MCLFSRGLGAPFMQRQSTHTYCYTLVSRAVVQTSITLINRRLNEFLRTMYILIKCVYVRVLSDPPKYPIHGWEFRKPVHLLNQHLDLLQKVGSS